MCFLAFGYDPVIEGFDQKPTHVNESGSHQRKTLAWKGSENIPLKEVQSQTRERWTLTTHVSSDVHGRPERPPLEALFKGGKVVAHRLQASLERVREEEYFLAHSLGSVP